MTVYKATDLYTQTWAHVQPHYTAEHGAYDVVMLDEAREAINQARREERERILAMLHDYEGKLNPMDCTVRGISRAIHLIDWMPEEASDD
jgi:tRNA(Met) C34 N-acetyltransferase TmcA